MSTTIHTVLKADEYRPKITLNTTDAQTLKRMLRYIEGEIPLKGSVEAAKLIGELIALIDGCQEIGDDKSIC